ncbi:DNA (cytosine-5-)-methyltransferase [Marinobacter sp. S6332]|uniref:DNA cytosine methyltransferase n=1 Tax=Marinobacter sp. S6332 TaxID=2926403 RepID=UPI001FF5B41A|nr:DNA (cytosine-5-)-methyltransferase [Marinobacter sp. S6332]
MNHIELFAGCGGLGLGLESVEFELVMANELSPMAAETFAYNFLDENLRAMADGEEGFGLPKRTKWLSSQFPKSNLHNRLRENPHEFPPYPEGESDINGPADLDGALVVGSIVELNRFLEAAPERRDALQSSFGRGGLDLVSGGPPCQSFSLAGLRQRTNQRNSLPWEMAKFVELTQPKFALLENVTGILRAFKEEGQEFHAWFEVAKAFAVVGYVPLCLHVNAKLAGVAQNRPRFIMLATRADIYEELEPTFSAIERELVLPSHQFYLNITQGQPVAFGDISYFDADKPQHHELYEQSFLRPLVAYRDSVRTVRDAIDDLKVHAPELPSEYVRQINRVFTPFIPEHDMENHEMRKNGEHVKRRFRIYQMLQKVSRSDERIVKALLKGEREELPADVAERVMGFDFLSDAGEYVFFQSKTELENYLKAHGTKKQTQKALTADSPAPAALSIPDDACHYDHDELRTLSVREMARIQSFPDGFAFRSKVTTGGQMRKYEVPQYTQVGNAVPPLLGRALGEAVGNLLKRLNVKELRDERSMAEPLVHADAKHT